MKCNGDCWACELEGCPNTLYSSEELDREIEKETRDSGIDNFNRIVNRRRKQKEWKKNNADYVKAYTYEYNHSEKGKERLAKYRKTDKYKETTRIYRESEKGQESIKKYTQSQKRKDCLKRYRDSEKGQESQKRYHQTESFKEKNRTNSKKYYLAHREEILAKRKRERKEKTG